MAILANLAVDHAVDWLAGFFVIHNLHDNMKDRLDFLFEVGMLGIVTFSETVFPTFGTNRYLNFARLVVAIWAAKKAITMTRRAGRSIFHPLDVHVTA